MNVDIATGANRAPKAKPRTRTFLASAALQLTAALALAGQAHAAVTTPIVSGLPWRSGTTGGGFPCLADLRGRALDANNIYITHTSFPAMVKQSGGSWFKTVAKKAPLWVVSLPLLTTDTKGQFAQCAAGAFDGSFRQIGANLQAAGARGTVVRLGWEANVGSGRHPWGVDTPGQVRDYVRCWRHAARALKVGGPGLNLDWTSAKKGQQKFNVLDMYPGDVVVDIIGVHQYDTGPEKSTQTLWDQYYMKTNHGGPWGLGTWLAAAKAHGKKLSVGEWAVWRQGAMTAAQADDPVFVDNMYRFFKANAAHIAYETYFNAMADQHLFCPTTRFPNAAAKYKADWRRG